MKKDKNPHAVALGRKGGKNWAKSLTEDELRQQMKERGKAGAAKRWKQKKSGH